MSRYYMVAASAESTVVAEYTPEPANAESYQSEAELERDFIRLFGSILRTRNILVSFDRFAGQDCLSEREMQNYQGEYLDLYQEEKRRTNEKENINGDLVFEIELIRQVEINIDYILMLVEKYHNGNCKDKEILATIGRAVHASLQLRSKKELIEGFIRTVNPSTVVAQDWQEFVQEHKERDLSSLIEEENLKPEEARRFLNNAFRDGALKTTGTDIDQIMPPVSRFGGSGRPARKQGLIAKLLKFFEKYFGLV